MPETLATGAPGWKQLLELGEQLLNQPTTAAQSELIVTTVAALLGGRVRVWLVMPAHMIPGLEVANHQPDQPPMELMRAAYTSRQVQVSTNHRRKSTAAAAPMTTQELTLGVIEVERPKGPAFTSAEIDLLAGLAAHAGLALHVSRQAATKNWRIEQLSLVRSVSAQIANALDLDELAHRVTRLILDTFHYYFVAIYTLDAHTNELRFRASAERGQPADTITTTGVEVALGEGLVGYAAQQGQEVLASDVTREPHFRYVASLPETRSEVAIPLKIEDRVLGVLDIQSNQADAFHEMDLLVLRALADNIAIAAEGTRLYGDLRRRAEQLSSVAEVSRAITSILDQETLLNEVVTLINNRFGYPSVHLFTVFAGRRKVVYRAGSGRHSLLIQGKGLEYDLDDPQGIIPWVARSGTTLLANDVTREPRYRPSPLLPEFTASELAVPLVYAGEILGVLDVQSDRVNGFNEDDRSLFEALADNISIALHNANLYSSEQWRRQVAESMRDVAGLLSANVALDQLLDAILTQLERNLPCAVSAIWLLDERSRAGVSPSADHLQLAAIHNGTREELIQALNSAPEVRDWLSKALVSSHPITRRPEDPFGPLGVTMNYAQNYSSVAAPLRVGNQPVGILALAHPEPGRYGTEARSMTAAFASYAAVAIENTRLYAAAQEQAWVSTLLLQVAEATQSLGNLDELLSTVVRLTPLLVGVNGCALFLWDPEGEAFDLNAIYGLSPAHPVEYTHRRVELGRVPAFDQLYFGRSPVVIHDSARELGLTVDVVEGLGTHEMVLIPLVARGEVLGAMLVEHRQEGTTLAGLSAFDDDQLAILQGIAQQTAVAVENLRLIEAKQEEAYVTAVLLQVAQAVVGSNDLDDVLASIVHLMPILVGIDCCLIYLWDGERDRFLPAQAYTGDARLEKALLERSFTPDEFPILAAAREGDSLIARPLGDPPASPAEWHTIGLPDGVGAAPDLTQEGNLLMAFPLSVKGTVFGVMLAQDAGPGRRFRSRRLEIINGIAQQTALAIQNDHLQREMIGRERLEREFQLAREIQQTFLPQRLPAPQGWELDARWRPATQVGGDFYDIFALPRKRLGLVIADVSDKGMPAALYMTVTRTLIRAAVREESSPARTLKRVNELLLMDNQNGMFITTVYAILDLTSGSLIYANAGHNLPFILHHDRRAPTRLEKGDLALGVMKNPNIQDHSAQLDPGDSLLLYTDGVTEAFAPDGAIFGDERLFQLLKAKRRLAPGALLDAIDAELREFQSGRAASDDITLLAIRRSAA